MNAQLGLGLDLLVSDLHCHQLGPGPIQPVCLRDRNSMDFGWRVRRLVLISRPNSALKKYLVSRFAESHRTLTVIAENPARDEGGRKDSRSYRSWEEKSPLLR